MREMMAINHDSLPAILGGRPSVTPDQKKACRWPVLTEEDEAAVLAVMRDGNISTHPVIRELEKDYARSTGQHYALAFCNGTTALLAAFHALNLKHPDEVIVPSVTFWASVLPMFWAGAIPVFCESELDRLGLDPDDLERKITERTRAIVVVHLWGLPSKMTEIKAIAQKHNLRIIEDASHAHGALWRGRPCGSLGDISVFSLQGDKLAPGGEGGILLCNDYAYFEKAVCLGDISRIIELDTPARRLAATRLGIKTRIHPLGAAISRVQLKHLERRNRKRNQNLAYLSQHLEDMGFHTFLPPSHIKRVYFEYIIRYDPDRISLPLELLINALQAEGCAVSAPRYPLLHQQPFFTESLFKDIAPLGSEINAPDYKSIALPKTESCNNSLIKLPSFPHADHLILAQYIESFQKVLNNAEHIRDHFEHQHIST